MVVDGTATGNGNFLGKRNVTLLHLDGHPWVPETRNSNRLNHHVLFPVAWWLMLGIEASRANKAGILLSMILAVRRSSAWVGKQRRAELGGILNILQQGQHSQAKPCKNNTHFIQYVVGRKPFL